MEVCKVLVQHRLPSVRQLDVTIGGKFYHLMYVSITKAKTVFRHSTFGDANVVAYVQFQVFGAVHAKSIGQLQRQNLLLTLLILEHDCFPTNRRPLPSFVSSNCSSATTPRLGLSPNSSLTMTTTTAANVPVGPLWRVASLPSSSKIAHAAAKCGFVRHTLRLPPSSPSSVSEACGAVNTRVPPAGDPRERSTILALAPPRTSTHRLLARRRFGFVVFARWFSWCLQLSHERPRPYAPSYHDELAPPGCLKHRYPRVSSADTRRLPENAASASLSADRHAAMYPIGPTTSIAQRVF